MLEVRWGCHKPFEERKLGLVSFLEGTVGSVGDLYPVFLKYSGNPLNEGRAAS